MNENIKEEEIINFLKKNKNFLIKNSSLLRTLEFPSKWKKKDKIIDFNAHQSNELKKENKVLKSKISKILNNSHINFISLNRILMASLKIITSNNLDQFLKIILKNYNVLFGTDIINIFSNNNKINNKYKNKIWKIDEKITSKIFSNKNIYLLNNKNYIPIFFPSSLKKIESFVLIKVLINKKFFFVICLGSKDKNKFSSSQRVELISFFIKVCEIKIQSLINS